MLKFVKYFICASLLAGIGAGAALSLRNLNSNAVKEAEATALNVSFTKVRDVAMELDDDPTSNLSSNSGNWAAPGSDVKHVANATSGTTGHIDVSLGELSSSKKWHAVFVEYTFSFTFSAYSDITLNFNYSLTSYRDQSSGAADHVMEIIYEGYNTSTGNTYSLSCGANNAATATSPNTNLFGSPVAYRVNSNTSGTVSSGNQSFSKTLHFDVSTGGTYKFALAFFSYIESSNYSHTHTATASLDLSITETLYDCSYTPSGGSIQYGAFTTAWNAVNANANGGTITLLKDVNVSSGFNASKNVTLNLNGYSITRNGSGEHANRYACIFSTVENSGSTFIISNNNKSTGGYVSTNYATSTVWINAGSTVTLTNGATLRNTYGVSGGGHVVVNSGGTLNILSSTLVGADSASSTTNTCVLLRNGAYLYGNGVVINGCTYSIRSDDTTNKDYVYLGGTCTIQRKVGIPSTAALDLNLQYNSSYVYGSGSSVLQLEFSTMPSPNSYIASCSVASSGINLPSKLQIIGMPDYMTISYITPKYYYVYKNYTINQNLTHLTTSNTSTGNHSGNWTTTLAPSDSSLYALPSTIMMSRGSTALVQGTDFTYNSSTGVVVVFAETFVGNYNLSISAAATLTTKGKAYEFIDNYMHMSDYTEELGYCNDYTHNYYGKAKIAFNNLETATRVLFMENADSKISDARDRFIAWASATGETITLVNGDYVINANRTISPINLSTPNGAVIVIISILSGIIMTSAIIATLKMKKKHQ
ncbi:MAG: hypothetical protein J5511_02275 [Bacilli bacterium]|nr:hypothetical protein [Bacilli bacterium]